MVKRVMDIVGSGVALFLLSWLLGGLAILVWIKLGSPILFRQWRPGLNGKPFELIKFRTQINARTDAGEPLTDDQRQTKFGRFLRRTSLDELPELWNVLRGEMSLVGPRPLLEEDGDQKDYLEKVRQQVRPGMTGWAQINGRDNITEDKKFELDKWYVANQSFWLDCKILLLTILKVVRRENVRKHNNSKASSETQATVNKKN
ncbi:sugar transferase [Alteromonas pelagimontana]|uniref:Sugar transferase n=1 Tax=Alteromonas pelagimontana TaxID=1858656 RepID=A0A6M4MF87_9ALTE|nr:sugar transferase [Alteromonas pelagimontana]QJR81538.1 sugar transferase [Alteromonas pelagimontana]